MSGYDDGAVALAEPSQQLDHLADGFDVHIREWLVEQEQLGGREQYAGKRSALAHALRVLAQGAGEIGIESHLAQGFGRAEAGATWVEAGEVAQVLLGGQLVVEHGCVAHVADAIAGVVRFEFAEYPDRSGAGTQQAGENAEERGFSGAVLADQDIAAAGLEIDRHLTERSKGAEELGDLIQAGGDGRAPVGKTAASGAGRVIRSVCYGGGRWA